MCLRQNKSSNLKEDLCPSKKIPVFFLQILNEIFPKKTGKSDMIKLILEITRNNLFKSKKSEKNHKSH